MIQDVKLVQGLAESLPEDCLWMEVGTERGDTAIFLLDTIAKSSKPGRPFFSIDPYDASLPYAVGDKVFMMPHYGEPAYKYAKERLEGFSKVSGLNYSQFRMTSAEFMETFKDVKTVAEGQPIGSRLGFVFLDGQHTGPIVTDEVKWFLARLHPLGAILIDDYGVLTDKDELDEIIAANPNQIFKNN